MTVTNRQALRPRAQRLYHAVLAAAGRTREEVCREVDRPPVALHPDAGGNGRTAAPIRVNGKTHPPSVGTPLPSLVELGSDTIRVNGCPPRPNGQHAPTQRTMTIGEFLPLYERNHVALLKSRRQTSRLLEKYLVTFATMELGALTRMQVIDWFHKIAETEGSSAANHAVEQLRSVYARAQDWEVFDGKNPADRIKKFPKHSRAVFVKEHEMPWLLASLAEELPRSETFFLTLLLTGARRDEARLMQWEHVDLEGALWHKPTTKTGIPHTVPLPALLVTKLRALPRVTDWVFPSTPNNMNGGQPGPWSVCAVEHCWRRVRDRAGLRPIRIHDLRRTAASWLAIHGANLPTIQQVLNHASLMSTQVYARLSIAPVRRALDEQAERMLGTMVPSLPARAHSASPSRDGAEWPG